MKKLTITLIVDDDTQADRVRNDVRDFAELDDDVRWAGTVITDHRPPAPPRPPRRVRPIHRATCDRCGGTMAEVSQGAKSIMSTTYQCLSCGHSFQINANAKRGDHV